ncbi:MAG TPA: hypothetical protein PKD98_30085 [Anaerolineae bacterium]|nr:hypothetical protein [Anaerolineae bacterium]
MNRTFILFSVVAVASLVVVLAASAAAVFAFTIESQPAQVEAVEVAPALEVAPVQAEVAPAIEKPVMTYQHASYEGGCAYSKAKMQLTKAAPAETFEDAPLAQVAQ